MTFLIKIDRSTVKENPDAGRTEYHELSSSNITMEYYWHKPELLPELKDIGRLMSCKLPFKPLSLIWRITASLIEVPNNIEEIMLSNNIIPEDWDCIVNNNFQHITSMIPEPKYFFKYVPTEVQCNECLKTFLHTELKSDVTPDDEYYSQTICPNCGCFDCCDIEFESL